MTLARAKQFNMLRRGCCSVLLKYIKLNDNKLKTREDSNSNFQIQHTSCTSGQWIHYLDGVQEVIRATNLASMANADPDLATLLDWVYYHEVLLRFTKRYWPVSKTGKMDTFTPDRRLGVSTRED